MKYIRTEDWVYAEAKYKVAKAFVSAFEEHQAKIMPTTKTNFKILKQADTIEELCDEFVIQFGDGTWETYKWFGAIQDCLKMDYYKNAKIYGAIWTDKGLIYVAKMNEKGELELL